MISKAGTVTILIVIGICLTGCFGIASGDHVNDVVTLLKANVGDDVIKAHITQKSMIFDLTTADIVKLKKAGASDDLLAFMMGSSAGDYPFELADEFLVKKPIVHEHLAIYPVFRKTSIDIEDYLTLDEAQHAHLILISEKPSASVPTVIIKNKGKKPIYIMAGEIIIGGKQDRMVSFDVIIPAGKTVEVTVRCVEHGRWHGVSTEFKSGKAVGGKGVRTALQFKEQQDVWDEVATACRELDVTTSSGTYGAVLSDEEVEKRMKPFLDAMTKGLSDEKIVGVIMALNGEMVCVDIFANAKFFAKVKEKLLKAYVLDAICTERTSTKIAGKSDILAFFQELEEGKTAESKRYDDNCNYEVESEAMIGNESRDKDGKVQHLNIYKK